MFLSLSHSSQLLRIVPDEELNELTVNRVSIEELEQRRRSALGRRLDQSESQLLSRATSTVNSMLSTSRSSRHPQHRLSSLHPESRRAVEHPLT